MTFESLLFDMDGTLWDSTHGITASWCELIEKRTGIKNALSHEDIMGIMGKRKSEIIECFRPKLGDAADSVIPECYDYEIDYIMKHGLEVVRVYDGVEHMLNTLKKKYNIFLISNCETAYIDAFYRISGFEKYFTDYNCEGRTGQGKAYNIMDTIKSHNLTNPVYIGDTAGDEKASHEAGIEFIHAAYGFGKSDNCLFHINSPEELIEKLDI